MLLISCALYAFRAAYISSIIRFSLVRPPFDIISSMLLELVNMCTGVGCLKKNPNCLRIAIASSNRSAKVITSADSMERATRSDLYELYEASIALWLSSVKKTICPGWDEKSALLANEVSLYAVILNELQSSLGIRMYALWLCTYLIALFKRV